MAYYFGPDGSKIPVDDHSTPEEKARAAQQWAQDHPPASNGVPIGTPMQWGVTAPDPNDLAGQDLRDEAAARNQPAAPPPPPPGPSPDDIMRAQQQNLDNHFQYGGMAGGAAKAAGYFDDQARLAQTRPGEQIDYGRANAYGAQAQGDYASQGRVADLMWKRANGLVPSIAQMQADRQMGQAAAEQTSAAASARGPGGLALAQQQAAANTAAAQSNISGQAQVNGANERMQAEQAAFGAYTGMRGQDFQGQGLEQDAAQKQAAINAAQRAANDQFSAGLYGMGVDVNKAQLGAQGNQVAIASGQQIAQNQLNQAGMFHGQDRTDKYIGYGLGAAGTAAGIGAMIVGGSSGAHADATGNVSYGDPGAGGYNGNAVADGSLDPNTSGGGYGQGGYGIPPDPSDVRAKQNVSPLAIQGLAGQMAAGAPQRSAMLGMPPAVGDPVTAQIASGLAPSAYDYVPGVGTPGRKVGPMAQNMAANPITGTAVRQGPDGMLGIDNADGLKVALASSGHLAKKQQITDAEIAKLKALAAQMQSNTAAQSQGLMAAGPAVGGGVGRLSPREVADLTSGAPKWQTEWNRSRGNTSDSGMSDEQDYNNNPQPYDDEGAQARNDRRGIGQRYLDTVRGGA